MSASTATGWWNAPTRFLPSGRFTAVLPPIAASTCDEERRRDLHDVDPAVVDRRREAGGVTDHATTDGDDRVAPEHPAACEVAAERLDGADRLRLLTVLDREHLRVPGARVGPRAERLEDRRAASRRRAGGSGSAARRARRGPTVRRRRRTQGRARPSRGARRHLPEHSLGDLVGRQLVGVDHGVRDGLVGRGPDLSEALERVDRRSPSRAAGARRRHRHAPPGAPERRAATRPHPTARGRDGCRRRARRHRRTRSRADPATHTRRRRPRAPGRGTPSSPPSAKSSATVRPAVASMTSSVSTNGRPSPSARRPPTVLFPAPIRPTRITWRSMT